ncbi:hypothetical protein Pint_12337 [Pistacia integerrima]|uniref:Uncharacterized protein n=1 Tax=Pistacia integerrima TaxID=434235 RepID=A0ACC0XKB6_9ROSI|nr:hypothetical protein Pint_12337 [Pistacia integerrima]
MPTSGSKEIVEESVVIVSCPAYEEMDEIETRKRHFKLYLAALKGDWDTAERIYKEDKIDLTVKLSKRGDTTLHIAVAAQRTSFVIKLVEQMKKEDLAIKNNSGNSAFFLAAASHSVEIVKAMIEKNEDVVTTRGDDHMLPLHKAALTGDKEIVEYLYEATRDELLDSNDRFELLVNLINSGLYDVALDLVDTHPEIATIRGKNEKTALHYLARMPVPTPTFCVSPVRRWKRLVIYTVKEVRRTMQWVKDREEQRNSLRNRKKQREKQWRKSVSLRAQMDELISRSYFLNAETPQAAIELTKCLWKQVILLDDSQILNIIRKPWPLIFEAAKQGNLAFINIMLGAYPDLVFEVDENHYSIFHFAVMYRQLNIFNIIYDIGSFKDLLVQKTDEKGNNILHLAAKLPAKDLSDSESGEAAVQLQEELL